VTLGKVGIPHETPTTPGLEGWSPQKSHGQIGLIWHAAARLLVRFHQPNRPFTQVNSLIAAKVLLAPAEVKAL
jgi:hypothetical protein